MTSNYEYGTAPGMPMETEGKNTGALVKADIALSEQDILRLGSEYQRYRLNDWWRVRYGRDVAEYLLEHQQRPA